MSNSAVAVPRRPPPAVADSLDHPVTKSSNRSADAIHTHHRHEHQKKKRKQQDRRECLAEFPLRQDEKKKGGICYLSIEAFAGLSN
jgi:hypothetical protein